MIDERMDLLIRRLDVLADPEPVFVETGLARLLPAVRDARRADASWIGRLAASVRWDLPGGGSPGRAVSIPMAVAVVVALLLATIGLTIVGSALLRAPIAPPPITYMGSFEPVDLGSDGAAFQGVAIGGGRVLVHAFSPDKIIRVWDPGDGTVRDAGMLLIARSDPAFVPLRDGRVLVVGGDTTAPETGVEWSAAPATAEVFDPVSGTSQAVGPLVAPRTSFATALLPDGRVLISGGYDPTHPYGNPESAATAEIFDPATGTFKPTGSMATARSDHASIALPDGRVLVWGGTVGLASPELPPEIFDPAAGVFSPAAPMGDTNYPGVGVVLLVDGRLLVIRNRCDNRDDYPVPDGHHPAEVAFYDPASGAYRSAGSVPNCVDTATALPNGDVLVTGFWWDLAANHDQSGGGHFRPGPTGQEMLLGWSALFDPDTGAVRETFPILNRGPAAQTILLPDGKVLFLDFAAANVFR